MRAFLRRLFSDDLAVFRLAVAYMAFIAYLLLWGIV